MRAAHLFGSRTPGRICSRDREAAKVAFLSAWVSSMDGSRRAILNTGIGHNRSKSSVTAPVLIATFHVIRSTLWTDVTTAIALGSGLFNVIANSGGKWHRRCDDGGRSVSLVQIIRRRGRCGHDRCDHGERIAFSDCYEFAGAGRVEALLFSWRKIRSATSRNTKNNPKRIIP